MAKGSLFGLAGAVLLMGCSTRVETGRTDTAGGSGDQPRTSFEQPIPGREPTAMAPTWLHDDTRRAAEPLAQFSCRKDAFCDDFESATPGSTWSTPAAAAGSIAFVGPSSSLGVRALRATADASGPPSFLELAGRAALGSWAGALGVSVRVDALPQVSIAGPEIVARDESGAAIARIAIVVTHQGLALEQRGAGCEASSCAARLDLLVPLAAGEWSRVVVGVEAQNVDAAPYGRVEISVDGSDNAVVPLVVRPIGGTVGIAAGITRADLVPSTLRVDDVMFFTR